MFWDSFLPWPLSGNIMKLGRISGMASTATAQIISGTETAQAGSRNRFAGGIRLGNEVTDYLSGEFRYLYHDGHPLLQAPGVKTDIHGQSHTLTLDLVVHLKKRDQRLRPFVGGGVGAKGYGIAGPAPFPQPAPQIATLTANDVGKVVFDLGGGTQYLIHRHYLATFARQQIVPAPHDTALGIFQQFTPLFGVSYTF
jgi:hypothetical protein